MWNFNSDKICSLFRTAFNRIMIVMLCISYLAVNNIIETNMIAYIYKLFFILFQQSLHTISPKRSLYFMYYLLDEKKMAYISNMHFF